MERARSRMSSGFAGDLSLPANGRQSPRRAGGPTRQIPGRRGSAPATLTLLPVLRARAGVGALAVVGVSVNELRAHRSNLPPLLPSASLSALVNAFPTTHPKGLRALRERRHRARHNS